MMLALLVLAFGCWSAYTVRRLLRHLMYFQIEEYQNGRFAAFVWANRCRLPVLPELAGVIVLCAAYLAARALLPGSGRIADALFLLCWGALHGALAWRRKAPPGKKPLVLTARARRLLGVGVALALGAEVAAAVAVAAWEPRVAWALPVLAVAGLAIGLALGLALIAANVVLYPVEESFRRYYVRSARAVFRAHGRLRVVAVTGSFGKTSTKELIAHLLSARYRVLRTPRSFNTLMGICRTIRDELKPEHEVFVVEMGAYKAGEIEHLCRLTPPSIGVLTAIGPQHLERFGTVERVAEAKYELMRALPEDGVGIFNGDDPRCRALAERPARFRPILYGLDAGVATICASDVRVTERGTEFVVRAGEASARFEMALLGRHNVMNALAAVAVGLECGMTLDEASAALRTARPVEHRLQRIAGAGGVTVIDDAYNANPAGVQMALEVMAAFPGGRKILITPGMVELGEREDEEHRRMGRAAAAVCDFVILVGAGRTQSIAAGLAEAGFDPERVQAADDLDDATRRLQAIVRPGDVVLFENDLPDTYDADAIYF